MKKLLAIAILLAGLGTAGFLMWDKLVAGVAGWVSPSQKDPVPTMRAELRDYRLQVPALGELVGLKTVPVITPRIRSGALKISWLAPEGSIIRANELLVTFDPTTARLALEQSENQLSSFHYQIERSEGTASGELTALRKDQAAAEMELSYASSQIRKDEDIFSRWEIQESIMSAALAEFRKGTLESQVGLRSTLNEKDLNILAIEQGKAKTEKDLAEETLSSLSLAAPVTGVIIYTRRGLAELEVGSEAWPGQPLMEIASLDQFRAKLQIPEKDIAGVQPDLPVEVELDAFPGRKFPGKVSQVARISKQIDRDDPRKYLECEVLLEVGPEMLELLKPGMSLRAEIVLGENPKALGLPRSALIKKDSGWVVFVAEKGSYSEQAVEILGSDHGFYLIKGLSEGDQVCLRHPFEDQKLVLPDFSAPAASGRMERFVIFN